MQSLQTRTNARCPQRRSAFTLLELLAVVTIIGLLVALLVPAVNAIRSSAKQTATSSTLSAISTGLETFKSDGRIGGSYPPSYSDEWDGSAGTVANPYRGPAYTGYPARQEVCGAGLLVWALAGADRLGTPGFKKIRSSSDSWSDDTDNARPMGTSDPGGLYAVYLAGDPKEGQPVQPRSGPYVDIDKTPITPFNERLRSFISKAETDAVRGQALPTRRYPMFLDAFGFPILYWRADPAGQRLADQNQFTLANQAERGIYHWLDNKSLITGPDALTLRIGAPAHQLEWTNIGNATNPPSYGFFPGYIRNPDVKAKLAPQKADSFLLVSAGEDGVYGTGDDVANFAHNGR